MACQTVSFEDVLAGACGAEEAINAEAWLTAPSKRRYTRPEDLVAEDGKGFDTRIFHHDGDFHRRRRRTSGAHLLPALQPDHAGRRSALPPRKPASSEAPFAQRPAENNYTRAAFLSHGDAIGLMSRRKGRPSTAYQLPDGWQPMPEDGSPLLAQLLSKGSRSSARVLQTVVAAAGKQQSGQGRGKQQQQEQERAYCSPEGLVLSEGLVRVQELMASPVVVPSRLISWLKDAAADPPAALDSIDTVAGQARLLGLCRLRVCLIPEERRRMEKRLELAAVRRRQQGLH